MVTKAEAIEHVEDLATVCERQAGQITRLHKRLSRKTTMAGHWLVTPRRGKNREFRTTKAMTEYLVKHPGCIVSWVAR